MIETQANKDYYLTTWREMLTALLGWSRWDVSRWAMESGKSKQLDDPDDSLYHESPIYWTIDLLMPDAAWRKLGPLQRVIARRDLLQALGHGQQNAYPLGTNWSMYEDRIEVVLNRFGATLPKMNRPFQESHTSKRAQGEIKGRQGNDSNIRRNLTQSPFEHYPHAV